MLLLTKLVPDCLSHSIVTMSLGDWLELNVGGRSFLTTRFTLTSCRDSALARMFDPNSGLRPAYSRNGVYFLDVDPDCFSVTLNWRRRRYSSRYSSGKYEFVGPLF